MRVFLFFLALIFLTAEGQWGNAAETGLPDISGQWSSAGPEDMKNGTYGTRHFVFTKERWSVTFIRYADREMNNPIYAFYGEGPYEIGGQSQSVEGAFRVVFRFSRKFVTVLTGDEKLVRKYRLNQCGAERYVMKDISEKGCSFFRSVADYGLEYDLVRKEEDSLYLGARPSDGNLNSEDKRPGALGSRLRKSGPASGVATVRPTQQGPAPAVQNPPIPDRGR